MQDMKRKIQHDAVNYQEDEDSCTHPVWFPKNVPVDKKEDKSTENSGAVKPGIVSISMSADSFSE
jgi:hypothetical protein